MAPSNVFCPRPGCARHRSEFFMRLRRIPTPLLDGVWFCSEACIRQQVSSDLRTKWNGLQRERRRQVPRLKLGTILMDSAWITPDQLDVAISLQRQTRRGKLGEWLLRLGYVEERQITMALSRQLGLPIIHLSHTAAKAEAARLLPGQVARYSNLVPVGYDGDSARLRIAISGPPSFNLQEAMCRMLGRGVIAYLGDESAILDLLEKIYPPEELDLSEVPTYSSLRELLDIGRGLVRTAAVQRAKNARMELVEELLWARFDFAGTSRNQFFRLVQPRPVFEKEEACAPQLAVAALTTR